MAEERLFLDTIRNLSRFHREHEKFYAQAPLQQAIGLQQASRVLKTLADHWAEVEPSSPRFENPYAGCEDLNETAYIQASGVLFTEGRRFDIMPNTFVIQLQPDEGVTLLMNSKIPGLETRT